MKISFFFILKFVKGVSTYLLNLLLYSIIIYLTEKIKFTVNLVFNFNISF